MFKNQIRRIIAKEGLIFIAVAIILYFVFSGLGANMPVVVPKYKVIFTNGEVYAIDIQPEISYKNVTLPKNFIKTVQNPPSKLISKRIQEFAKLKNIRSSVREARCINSKILYLSGAFYSFLMSSLFLKTIFVYLFFLLIRYIIWAVKVLSK